jgi:hypothetical protein
LLTFTVGCVAKNYSGSLNIPKIEVPTAPEKPEIKTKILSTPEGVYIGYTIPHAMKLYKFLLEKDAYEDKLIFRINEMNRLLGEIKK